MTILDIVGGRAGVSSTRFYYASKPGISQSPELPRDVMRWRKQAAQGDARELNVLKGDL